MREDLKLMEEEISLHFNGIDLLNTGFAKAVIGQKDVFRKLLICLLTDGHMLLEGVPGIAKTLMAHTFARLISVDMKRIQFTPDLIPGDIIGTVIFNPQTQEFYHREGPVFTNILLADEINRAPAKVQSALLEAMQERQVTIGEKTYKLQEPFFVIATQNPIEQEGTYPLPEAQLDRFMFKTIVPYPAFEEEKEILSMYGTVNSVPVESVTDYIKFKALKDVAGKIFIDPKLKDYLLGIVSASRDPESKDTADLIRLGASPRASLYLLRAAKANAFLEKRAFVIPEDIQKVSFDILRHRLIISFNAVSEGITSDDIIKMILKKVRVP